jgi:hypothetical protein
MKWADEMPDLEGRAEEQILRAASTAIRADVVVMTQACDLEDENVANVILCPHVSLDEYKVIFEEDRKAKGQTPTPRAWQHECNNIRNGFVWNLAMLNMHDGGPVRMSHRVVDFSDIYSIPRKFLESLLRRRQRPRLRLLPPYREHLSQAFARFFMRVGLPEAVTPVWQDKG